MKARADCGASARVTVLVGRAARAFDAHRRLIGAVYFPVETGFAVCVHSARAGEEGEGSREGGGGRCLESPVVASLKLRREAFGLGFPPPHRVSAFLSG